MTPTGPGGELRILLLGGGDVADIALQGAEGRDHPLESGLREAIETRTGGQIATTIVDRTGTSITASAAAFEQALAEGVAPDLMLCGFREDLRAGRHDITATMTELIHRAKAVDTRVIALNASTVHPDDQISCYRGVGQAPALAAHRLDLALIRLSIAEGISVVDVDRIIAEMGGDRHVHKLAGYSRDACATIRDELVHILDEYGFFDDRPLLEQHGPTARI